MWVNDVSHFKLERYRDPHSATRSRDIDEILVLCTEPPADVYSPINTL